MLAIYVKHYLTEEGIKYFKETWFPKVYSFMAAADGFVSLGYIINEEEPDLVEITLQFEGSETLDSWLEDPVHDALLRDLDKYRSRKYWKFVRANHESVDPSKLEWIVVKPGSY